MDRLLQFLLSRFIERGTFKSLPRAAGHSLAAMAPENRLRCDLPPGLPSSAFCSTRTQFGEAYMDGTLVVEQGTIADVLAIALGQQMWLPNWAWPQWLLRIHRAAPRSIQSPHAGAAQRRASL